MCNFPIILLCFVIVLISKTFCELCENGLCWCSRDQINCNLTVFYRNQFGRNSFSKLGVILDDFEPMTIPDAIEKINWKIIAPNATHLILMSKGGRKPQDGVFENLLKSHDLQSKIENVSIEDNHKVTTVPAGLKNFQNLQQLNIERTSIQTISVYGINSLRKIFLKRNRLTYLDKGGFSQLDNLEQIEIYNETNMQIRPGALDDVGRSLRSLAIRGSRIKDEDFKNIGRLPNLVELDVSDNELKFEDVQGTFENFPALKTLKINRNPVEELDVDTFEGAVDLENLHIIGTRLETFNIAILRHLERMKEVKVTYNKRLHYVKYDPRSSMSDMPNNTRIDFSHSSIARLDNTWPYFLECNRGRMIFSGSQIFDCTKTQTLEWLAYYYQPSTSNFSLDITNVKCNHNYTRLIDIFNRINASRPHVTCRGTFSCCFHVILHFFIVVFVFTMR